MAAVSQALEQLSWRVGRATLDTQKLMTRELSPQQSRVMALVARGMSNKQIAFELDMAMGTVKAHVVQALKRMGVQNRVQAAIAIVQKDVA